MKLRLLILPMGLMLPHGMPRLLLSALGLAGLLAVTLTGIFQRLKATRPNLVTLRNE